MGDQATNKKKIGPAKAVFGTLAGLVVTAAAVLVGFNIYIRTTYEDFYESAAAEFWIPGTDSGFVVQDIDYVEDGGVWLFSGYMANGSPSPIWRLAPDGSASKVFVTMPDGSSYAGHGGGLSDDGSNVFLTREGGYTVIPLADVLGAADGEFVSAVGNIDVGFDPAFLNIQDNMMFTGVFYHAGQYDTPDSMHIVTPDGTLNRAIMYAYSQDESGAYGFAATPQAVYSIPDMVQGVCITKCGSFVFSTSWALNPSHLYKYSGTLVADGTFDVDGKEVPLFCFDSRSYEGDVQAPPMGEGIVLHDDRVFLPNEAASNKYVFGKLYGAGRVYSIDM